MNLTKNEVKEKLIFYTILKKENLIPTEEEELKAVYRKGLENYFKYNYGKTADDYKTAEEYEAALESFKSTVIKDNGESVYKDQIYYFYAIDTIISYAPIVNTCAAEV